MTAALADRPPLCGHTWTGPTPRRRVRLCPDGGPHTCHALAEVHLYDRHRCLCGATTAREDDTR